LTADAAAVIIDTSQGLKVSAEIDNIRNQINQA